MTHWYDVVFWIFFGAGVLFILGIWILMLVGFIRERRRPFVRTHGATARSTSSHDTTWGVGGTDSSTGFETSSSDSVGSDSGGSDSGGGFESGGGESGGGGSSGGWND